MCPITDTHERTTYSESWLNVTFRRMSRFCQNQHLYLCLCGRVRAQIFLYIFLFTVLNWRAWHFFNIRHSRNSKRNFIKMRSINTLKKYTSLKHSYYPPLSLEGTNTWTDKYGFHVVMRYWHAHWQMESCEMYSTAIHGDGANLTQWTLRGKAKSILRYTLKKTV